MSVFTLTVQSGGQRKQRCSADKGSRSMQALSTSIPQSAASDDRMASPRREDVALLFTELRRPLVRYLLSLSLSPAEADDVVQETFLRLCEQFASGSCVNLRAWIFRVAHNLAFDQHRRRLRQPVSSYDPAPNSGEPPLPQAQAAQARDPRCTPEEHAIEQQRMRRLEFAMDRLPQHQQFCLHLRAEGLRYREVAEVLGVGTSTVADWVQAALERLAKELK